MTERELPQAASTKQVDEVLKKMLKLNINLDPSLNLVQDACPHHAPIFSSLQTSRIPDPK